MAFIDVDLLKESVLGWNPPLDTEQLKHMIDTIPLADVVEVKHGEWIAKASTHISKRGRLIYYDRYKCSVCGVWNGRHKQSFCPHCGAKMDDSEASCD